MASELWPGGPLFSEAAGVFRLGADSLLLANFANSARISGCRRAVELGCGSGIISLLLAWDNPGLYIDCIEIQPGAARLAEENIESNSMSDRLVVIEGDLRNYRVLFRSGAYDFTISNPPYNAKGSGKRAYSHSGATARAEEQCTLADICNAAGFLTRNGGSFYLVHKPERLAEVFRLLSASGFEPKRMRFVQHKTGSPPSLILIESRRNAKPSLSVEPPLILKKEDDSDTEEAKLIYRII